MKNLLISLVVVGALSAPMAYAEGEAAAAPAAEAVQTVAPVTEVPAAEPAKSAPKKKHHHGKKKKEGKKRHKCKDCQHKKAKAQAEASHETPAEQKIDQETELNNR